MAKPVTFDLPRPPASNRPKATQPVKSRVELEVKAYRFLPSMRFVNIMLNFFGAVCSGTNFSTLNFTVACFVNSTMLAETDSKGYSSNGTTSNAPPSNCPSATAGRSNETPIVFDYGGDVPWTRSQQVNVIAAIAWSGTVFTIPMGIMIHKFGTKRIVLTAQLVSGIANAVVPNAIYWGEWYAFGLRFCAGMMSGSGWPAIMYMVTRWAPASEVGFMTALASGGYAFGVVIAYLVAGWCCGLGPRGWQYAIYYSAGLNAIFVVVYQLFFTNSPEENGFISKQELNYILATRNYKSENEEGDKSRPKLSAIPWKRLLTSAPVWAAVCSSFCFGWGFTYVSNFLPTYMKEALYYDSSSNGIFSSFPNIFQFIGRMIFGAFSDKLTSKVGNTVSVKIFNSASLLVVTLGSFITGFMDCRNSGIVVACFAIGHFFLAASVAGYLKSMYFIAPRYISIITMLGGIAVNLPAIVLPYVVGAIIVNGTLQQWQTTFFLSCGIYVLGTLIFICFGTGKEQEWAKASTALAGEEVWSTNNIVQNATEVGSAAAGSENAVINRKHETSNGEAADTIFPRYTRLNSAGGYVF